QGAEDGDFSGAGGDGVVDAHQDADAGDDADQEGDEEQDRGGGAEEGFEEDLHDLSGVDGLDVGDAAVGDVVDEFLTGDTAAGFDKDGGDFPLAVGDVEVDEVVGVREVGGELVAVDHGVLRFFGRGG